MQAFKHFLGNESVILNNWTTGWQENTCRFHVRT